MDRRGVLGWEDEGRPGSDWKTRCLNASEGNRMFLQNRTESTALTLMSGDWIMNNHSQSGGQGEHCTRRLQPGEEGPLVGPESDHVSLNHTEAVAGEEHRCRTFSHQPLRAA